MDPKNTGCVGLDPKHLIIELKIMFLAHFLFCFAGHGYEIVNASSNFNQIPFRIQDSRSNPDEFSNDSQVTT